MKNRPLKFRIWDGQKFLNEENHSFYVSQSGDLVHIDTVGEQSLASENNKVSWWTGFFDKNGREIYEGDVFKGGTYKWWPVEFMNGSFVASLKGARVYDLWELVYNDNGKPEIIGNIYENPELID